MDHNDQLINNDHQHSLSLFCSLIPLWQLPLSCQYNNSNRQRHSMYQISAELNWTLTTSQYGHYYLLFFYSVILLIVPMCVMNVIIEIVGKALLSICMIQCSCWVCIIKLQWGEGREKMIWSDVMWDINEISMQMFNVPVQYKLVTTKHIFMVDSGSGFWKLNI